MYYDVWTKHLHCVSQKLMVLNDGVVLHSAILLFKNHEHPHHNFMAYCSFVYLLC